MRICLRCEAIAVRTGAAGDRLVDLLRHVRAYHAIGRGGRPVPQDREDLVVRLAAEGVPKATIAQAANVSRGTVYNILRRRQPSVAREAG